MNVETIDDPLGFIEVYKVEVPGYGTKRLQVRWQSIWTTRDKSRFGSEPLCKTKRNAIIAARGSLRAANGITIGAQ